MEKIVPFLKRIRDCLIDFFNYVLLSFVYFFGVSLSFLFWKISNLGKEKVKRDTYWEDFTERKENYKKMY